MRTQTITKTLYKFDELSNEAKEKAIEKHREFDSEMWDPESVLDDAKEIAGLMGIEIDKTYYSGFWSQGDGACFTGVYSYRKGSVKAVKHYAPMDTELHRIAQGLQDIQKSNFYGLSAVVDHSGHYYHELCTHISVERSADNYQDMTADAEQEITELLRDYMQWIYSQLEKEYEYQASEPAIIENIEANDYEFDEFGNLA